MALRRDGRSLPPNPHVFCCSRGVVHGFSAPDSSVQVLNFGNNTLQLNVEEHGSFIPNWDVFRATSSCHKKASDCFFEVYFLKNVVRLITLYYICEKIGL